MPYQIDRVNNKYELRLKDNNELLGTHTSKEKAKKQIMAIEAQKHNPSKVINKQRFFLSEKPHKKLKVRVGDTWVHFGDNRYQHYYDKTGLLDKSYNHLDDDRREKYLKRATKIKNKEGKYTKDDIYSPNRYAISILW